MDAIIGIFLCPTGFFVPEATTEGSKVTPESTPRGFSWGATGSGDTPIQKLNTLNGYSRNNKLKTYPYMYLLMDNGNGSQAIYRYEDFNTSACDFTIVGTPSLVEAYYVMPENYGGSAPNNYKNRLHGGKIPTCGFQNDTFINWLTANAVPIVTSVVEDSLSLGVGSAEWRRYKEDNRCFIRT